MITLPGPHGIRRYEFMLRAGESEQTVTLPALAARWRGEFSTLCRAPPGYRGRIEDNARGPVIDWLAARLAALDGRPPPSGAASLDAGMKARVMACRANCR